MTAPRPGPPCPEFPEKVVFISERAAKRALHAFVNPLGNPRPYRCGAHWHIGKGSRTRKTPGGRLR